MDWIQLVHVCWQAYVSTVMNEPLGFIETREVLRSLFCWVVTQCMLVVFFNQCVGTVSGSHLQIRKKLIKILVEESLDCLTLEDGTDRHQ